MIYGSAVRSKYPRARVLAIHKEKAEALPGVVGVYTADDIPGKVKVGHLMQDWDTMIPVGKITHYLGLMPSAWWRRKLRRFWKKPKSWWRWSTSP